MLYLQRESVLNALYHSRPRDLHRMMCETPGVEFMDPAGPPPPGAGKYDILLIGPLGHPIAKPVPADFGIDASLLHRASRRVVMVHDTHRGAFRGGHARMREFIRKWAHYVILAYESEQSFKLLEGCENVRKVYLLGNYIDMDVFRDRGLERKIDVLLYGQLNERDYPFRRRLAYLLPKTSLATHVVPHPAETGNWTAPRDTSLSELINQSWLAIATPTRYKFLLAKYMEIAASRTVVAGNLPRRERDFWRRCYVRLNESMSDEEIVRRLTEALADKPRLLAMADQMYGKVRERYGYPQFRESFVEILQDIYRAEPPEGR